MMLRLAIRSLVSQPVRSAVLAGGFGMGIGAMAGLLGIGEVILEQSTAPELFGGGDLVITGRTGQVENARFLMSAVLGGESVADELAGVSPTRDATLYVVENGEPTVYVRARGGVPSLQRAVGDPEIEQVPTWRDLPADRAWVEPEPAELLRSMDRFHPIPDVPDRAESWAEWLYFNGRSDDGVRFYLTFLAGAEIETGRRAAGVRLQLERDGRIVSFAERAEVSSAELLAAAPDLDFGRSRVRLDGLTYRIHLELFRQTDADDEPPGPPDLVGDLTLEAVPGRSLAPIRIRGARGWVSGYVVPVLSGRLDGRLQTPRGPVEFRNATGYHDHNWGFWRGVTWQWGQVAGPELSLVYGRVFPPADAANADRVPGFLVALGPDGPAGYSTNVRIEEVGRAAGVPGDPPATIRVDARGVDVDLNLAIEIDRAERTRFDGGPWADPEQTGIEFLQLGGTYRVNGRIGDREVAFEARGSAETFRRR